MGRQRVDLSDAGHIGDKGRADRAARADDVAVRHRLVHQLHSDVVERGEAVADDGAQFLVDARAHDVRELLAVDRLGAGLGQRADVLLGEVPVGLESLRALRVLHEDAQLGRHPVRDGPRRVDHDPLGFLGPQVGKLRKHVVGGPKVERRLVVAVLKALGVHEDRAEDGIPRLLEVHVAGGHHRDTQPVAELHDLAVQLLQRFIVRHRALPDQEGVVAGGLDFEVIVELRDALEVFIRLSLQHRAEKLARLAGAADDEPLPVFFDHRARKPGRPSEVVQVRLADQPVEVGHALLGGGQQDDVAARPARVVFKGPVDLVQQPKPPAVDEHFEHLRQRLRGGAGVVHRPVRVFEGNAQPLADRAQLVALLVAEHVAG